jgi:hypothetical protein
MEENQNLHLSGYDLVLFSFYCTGQDDQEAKVELYSSNAGFVSVCFWEVGTLFRPIILVFQ